MRSLCLEPTDENVLTTFCEKDIRDPSEVMHFCNFLNSIDGRYSIALDSKWGSGKTFFIKQVKMILDYSNPQLTIDTGTSTKIESFLLANNLDGILTNINSHSTIYYDAWENDNDVDPILSLMYQIIKIGHVNPNIAKKHNLFKIATSIGDMVTGRNISGVFESMKLEDCLLPIEEAKSAHDLMQEFINLCIEERANKLVIFIDELDRCKPTYAVQLLERIKHYFNDERVIFVFSVNTEQLQHTIKKHYGHEFNASRYLDKFFDMRLSLEPVDHKKFLSTLIQNKDNYYYDIGNDVIEFFGFNMRNITRYAPILKSYEIYSIKERNSQMDFLYRVCLVPILLGLRLDDMAKYNSFINGQNSEIMVDILARDTYLLDDFEFLLEEGEAFIAKEGEDKKLVNIKDKLEEVYNALFATKYKYTEEFNIGKLKFNKHSKANLLDIIKIPPIIVSSEKSTVTQ